MPARVVPLTTSALPLGQAAAAFLAQPDLAVSIRRSYQQTLGRVERELGADRPLATLTVDQVTAAVTAAWGGRAPATWNRHVATVRSFLGFCRRRRWVSDDLTVDLERREPADRTKAIPLAELERLWRRDDLGVREKALWRLLYETAARATEALSINVEDLRPYFGSRQLRQITPSHVLRWQHELEQRLSHSGVMACRSILGRILEAARKERLIATNPVREVEAPKPRLDPEQVFGHQRRRTLTPEEVGHLLAVCRPFYRDHFLIQVGTGLRSGELLGLHRRRVFPELGRIEVIEVRYEAGRFGRGFKAEPKSLASVRVVPMCDQVRQAITRQLTGGTQPEDLVLPGPGGSNGIPRGARAPLSTNNLRRVYKAAVEAAGADLADLDLRGPHDLRHTFATWLEDGAIPSRVIDELMGHASGRPDHAAGGSPMGRSYRETTPAMVARVTAALDDRIGRAQAVAAHLLREGRDWRAVDGGEGL